MVILECKSCGTHKPTSEFPKDARKNHGVGTECKTCMAARARARRLGITCVKEHQGDEWTCTVCGETKELSEDNFYTVRHRHTKYDSMCRVCRNEYHRTIRRKQYDTPAQRKQRELNSEREKIKHRKLKVAAIKYKGSKCTRCGLEYDGTNAMVFDFHHIDPSEKESQALKNSRQSLEAAKKELDKCVLLCANCHRTVHSTEY